MSRISAVFIASLVVAACGGGSQPTIPAGGSQAPGQSAAATPPVVQPGEPIDSAVITAAVDALRAQDSWQFTVQIINAGTTQSITGTERTTPERAVDASHSLTESPEPFRYIRIGDDIWYDVGTGQFTQVQAANAENLIAQYEPFYINGLKDSAEVQGYEFDFVDNQTVNGLPSAHYLLSEADRENIVETINMDPADFAGDVYIATAGGFLTRLTWGPQSVEDAQVTIGFDYQVTAVNCECPIDPPTQSSGGVDPY
jgi:hypothetical protein